MSLFAMSIRSLRKQLRQSRFFSRLYYAFGLDALPVLLQFPSYRRSQNMAIDKYASEDQPFLYRLGYGIDGKGMGCD